MNENNNVFLYNLKMAIKDFTNFITVKPITQYEATDDIANDMIVFYNSYSYLNYAINVIYSKEFYQKGFFDVKKFLLNYEFAFNKDQEKLNTIYFIFPNLIKIIEGHVFYSKFCTKILKYPANQLSTKLLNNNRNLKNLESYELANFLMLVVYEPMLNYVESQKEILQTIFIKSDSQQLNKMFYELDLLSRKMIHVICSGKKQYSNDCDDNVYMKVRDIRVSDKNIKILYQNLRDIIIEIFPKQKDVRFPISNQSSLSFFIFNDNNINFKDFIKLIVKNETWPDFIKNIKEKGSEYMTLKYWHAKIMSNIGNMILMHLENDKN